jgi:hypothetical protein
METVSFRSGKETGPIRSSPETKSVRTGVERIHGFQEWPVDRVFQE